jgi:hypothetical protein
MEFGNGCRAHPVGHGEFRPRSADNSLSPSIGILNVQTRARPYESGCWKIKSLASRYDVWPPQNFLLKTFGVFWLPSRAVSISASAGAVCGFCNAYVGFFEAMLLHSVGQILFNSAFMSSQTSLHAPRLRLRSFWRALHPSNWRESHWRTLRLLALVQSRSED